VCFWRVFLAVCFWPCVFGVRDVCESTDRDRGICIKAFSVCLHAYVCAVCLSARVDGHGGMSVIYLHICYQSRTSSSLSKRGRHLNRVEVYIQHRDHTHRHRQNRQDAERVTAHIPTSVPDNSAQRVGSGVVGRRVARRDAMVTARARPYHTCRSAWRAP
jgi:hypothetical protein